jgi:glutathione S-transferase
VGQYDPLYGFGRVHRRVIGETRDLGPQRALEEVGLPYRVHALNHTNGELDGSAYSRISCFH